MRKTLITIDKIWRMRNETGQYHYMSLMEILKADTQLEHAPAIGFYAPVQHELLASILQYAVDTLWVEGLNKKKYKALLLNENIENIKPLFQKIRTTISQMEGFSLFGHNAFMQMPHCWRHEGRLESIEKLLYPFVPMAGSTSKGLRRKEMPVTHLDTSLTVLALFAHSLLVRSGLQYWSCGPFANRVLAHINFGKTMRQKLFACVLPGVHSCWKPVQQLPWVTNIYNAGGLRHDRTPPMVHYLKKSKNQKAITSTAVLRFHLSRSMILGPPSLGRCSVTNRQTIVFKNLHLWPESAVRKLLLKYNCQAKDLPKKVGGIMQDMYSPETMHPSILYRDDQQTDKKYNQSVATVRLHHPHSYLSNDVILKKSIFLPRQSIEHTRNPPPHDYGNFTSPTFFFTKYAKGKQVIQHVANSGYLSLKNFKKQELFIEASTFLEEETAILRRQLPLAIKGLYPKYKAGSHQVLSHSFRYLLHLESVYLLSEITTQKYKDIPNWKKMVRSQFLKIIDTEWINICEKMLGEYPTMNNRFNALKCKQRIMGVQATSASLAQKSSSPTILAGRVFAQQFNNFSSRDRAKLRQTLTPQSTSQFWNCMKKAQKEQPSAFVQLYEKALPLFGFCTPIEDGKSIGHFLQKYQRSVNPDRIEHFFQENNQWELISQLISLCDIIFNRQTPHKPTLDYGILMQDLSNFHFNPVNIQRKWGNDFFATSQQGENK